MIVLDYGGSSTSMHCMLLYCLRTLRPEINQRTSSPLCLVISHLVSDSWVKENQHFFTLALPALPVCFLFFVVAHLCNLERNWLHTFTKNLFDASKLKVIAKVALKIEVSFEKSYSIISLQMPLNVILSNAMTFTCLSVFLLNLKEDILKNVGN